MYRNSARPFFAIALCFASVVTARAERPSLNTQGLPVTDYLPEGSFDTNIQTPEQFFGFKLGSRHLLHHQVAAYSQYLAEASPHLRMLPYATSHGQRSLYVLLVTRDADTLDLQQLEQQRRSITSGDSTPSLDGKKAVAYVGYTIHGDEASGINAFPAVAYYLAAGSDTLRNQTLDRSILLIDPCLNPDGSDRFANWVNENRSRFPGSHDQDREHSQSWPRGRSNYYWFDLNRDWLPTAHPESPGRIELFHQMKPNVVLDFHEMGSSSSYFFQPGIPARNNPLTPDSVFQLTRQFAAEHAKAMDQAGELYFTEERFDDFYMGKGSTYPDLHGAIGILFEQGSSRGLLSSNDRYTRSFTDTVANQVRTTISSLTALDKSHDQLLQHQADFYQEAMRMAESAAVQAYVLHARGDTSRISAAAELLRRHDIQLSIPTSAITVDGIDLAAGSALIIPAKQPEYRFLQSLMQREQTFRENIFYDVSAWTLPLAFDLDVIEFRSDLPENWTGSTEQDSLTTSPVENESESDGILAYAIEPISLDAPSLIVKLMELGCEVRVAYDPFTAEDREGQPQSFVRGTWLVAKPTNTKLWDELGKKIADYTRDSTVKVTPLLSGLSPIGPDLGSDANKVVPQANVLLVVGEGTSSLDAGALWHFFDHRFELPATIINAEDLSGFDLASYSCVVMPNGSYQTISASGLGKLEDYVAGGGTVVALQSAINWLQAKGLVSKQDPVMEPPTSSTIVQPQRFADASDASALESIAGAIFEVKIDATHPLAFGFPDASVPVFRDSETVYPVPSNYLTTAGKYEAVMAGYVSARNRERIANSAAVWAENKGSGRVICIADNPVFRGYFRGSERFLTNAILLGPTLRVPALVE